ncbi:DNA cytosine methyltransferase [Elizabethkingia meningoseptica]|uniref:DNA cytosine methyltransferase n=1 Tax=Elizabethkingia meningoseptica TaxID=238 RepID=UPI001625651E|nr:DNA cytosine methyltransferase [Elizabethkingia meningoseptica]MBG0512906.1 DNA cytosine methyltransferase [Elizabethkingia meningoseptica]MBG0515173.1 DNA cytosine methyltransferase [Elizabethkingia meningoseptica]
MNNRYIKLASLAISLLYVDLFCGAGGTSTGVELAQVHGEKCAIVVACVNHDPNAIASHAYNHPSAVHYIEDIRTLNLAPLVIYVNAMRKKYPFAKLVLWASLECTNHSKAKGGMSRDADSRTLADHLFRYIDALNPDSVQIENVEEFLIWGPLIEKVVHKNGTSYCPLEVKNGHISPVWIPDPERKAEYYNKWVSDVKKHGYNYDYRLLNAADFGAYTSRKRLFIQFNKPSMPIVWPEPTHAKNPTADLFGQKEKWKAVKEVLDFEDEGNSIFGRKKDLVEASLERFYEGLIKFVAGGKDKWLLKYNSTNQNGKHNPPGIDDPCPVISTQNRLGIATVDFLSKYYSGKPEHKNITVEGPAGTIKTIDSHALIQPKFLTAYYGNGFASSVENPSPTVTTGDRFNIVSTTFIDQQFGNSKPASINTVLGAITTNPKYAKVNVEWVMNTNFKNIGSSIDDPAPTITANRKWHYLVDAQYSRVGNSIDQPCFTLIARMDKTPPYIVEITQDNEDLPYFIKIIDNVVVYEIYEDDSPMMKKIKEFMAHYGLKDIKMRMLKIQELKEIMGFPEDYKLIGTQAEQKKYIGNAVEVTMAKVLCEAMAFRLHNNRIAA